MSYELPYENESFDRVFSTLMFHHLTTEAKRKTLAEIRRVLRPGGQFHLADWGAPRGPLIRAQFFLIQLLDGFETTRDNVRDMLPRLMSGAGLECTGETRAFQTILGRVALWRATI